LNHYLFLPGETATTSGEAEHAPSRAATGACAKQGR
jgi:hypothetical protein